MYTIPSLRAVTLQLRQLNNQLRRDGAFVDAGEPQDVDVRIQVLESPEPGTPVWRLHSGDASYATDHHGAWAAGSIPADESEFEAETIARRLLDDVAGESMNVSDEPPCLCRWASRDLCHYHAFVDGQ